MNTTKCPYCGSVNVEYIPESTTSYYCYSCDTPYSTKDIQYEDLRRKMKMLLVDTTEEKPKEINTLIMEDSNETCGLSTNELPLVTSIFEDSEGIVWFNICGMDEPIEFDDLDYEDVLTIYNAMIKS